MAKQLSEAETIQEETPESPQQDVPQVRENKRIDAAIQEFYNEDSVLTLSEKMANLRKALMWQALKTIERVNKFGSKSPVSAEEDYRQKEMMKQFTVFEKMYESEVKATKLEGKSTEDMDRQWLKDIKNEKSTVGSIVRSMTDRK